MQTIKLPLTGGCQCGAVRYEITAAPVVSYCCHCTNCQRVSASAFNISIAIPIEGFRFNRGEPAETTWASGKGNRRLGWFCGDCGTRIAHKGIAASGTISLRGGSLDDLRWLTPAGHIWTRSTLPWVRFEEGALIYECQPDDFSDLAARFQSMHVFQPCDT